MKAGLAVCVLLATTTAWAAPGERRGERVAERLEKVQRARKEMELRRTLRIADELALDETKAFSIRDVLRAGDEKRQKLEQDVRTEVVDLKRMGDGSPTLKDVDGKVRRIQDLRAQLLKAEEEQLEAASKGLSPQQKAKLAILLGVHERQMKAMMFREIMRREGGRERAADDGFTEP